ncbi:MAG: riboflavin synthase [Solirubrobacterales bacterium]|nr:riboflavin synthase [Solirubrobacterales bacterium]MBV9168025.1 riboflavin synthase [Solirubrobacterales bacterium]MBV9536168.1 riboflavin synthase [Solirubrobacterales bacterium]
MFTGIVQDIGRIERIDRQASGARVTVEAQLAQQLQAGDSIALSGVCVTAQPDGVRSFRADLMNETLARSSLADAQPGTAVNLELPLRPTDRIGGHIVQGHVDGVGTVASVTDDGFARVMEVKAPERLLHYAVEKGSIALDGVSLTVAELRPGSFTVSLIPETLRRTTLGQARAGTRFNLEVDVLAKYVERLIQR